MEIRPNTCVALLDTIAGLLAVHLVVRPTTAAQGGDGAVLDLLRVREIHVLAKDGQVIVRIAVGENGAGLVATSNTDGQNLVELTATKDGEGMVVTRNGDGHALVELSVTKNHDGRVVRRSASGRWLPPTR
jgi:hypothetical protein